MEKVSGVKAVTLEPVDGVDMGHYDIATMEMGSADKAAATEAVDRAMAILWQGDEGREMRAIAWTQTSQARLELANARTVDPDLAGATYQQAMTKRYGAWPGRGVPPS